jgi:hypothetical protein
MSEQKKTYEELGKIMLAEVGEEKCQSGYHTKDPEVIGRLALGYGDINDDGTLN